MIQNITKWPVVILANYRSGSTELGYQIARTYGVDYYPEPIRQIDNTIETISKRLDLGDNKFVVKFMPDQLDQNPIHKRLLDIESFKIKITRDNIVEQSTSYYIAKMTDNWAQTVDSIPDYYVENNKEVMEKVICVLLQNNHSLDNLPIVYDAIVKYEDLDFSKLTKVVNRKTTPPSNELLIKATVIRMVDKIKREGTW